MSNEENRASDDVEVEAAEVSVEEVPVNEAEVVSEDAAVEAKAAPEIDVEDLLAQLATAKKEAAEASIRAQAEIQNVRRRVERDVESAHKFALEKFAGELLAVADSLERGLTSLDENDETLKVAREGNILTLKIFNDVLQKFKIEELDPIGEPFDPQFHEAMTMVPNPDAEPNSVMDVLQKGYTLNGRLIRPARVVVVKAP